MPAFELEQGKLIRKEEIVLCFKVISPEARAKIDQATKTFIDTEVRAILEADPAYCRARGWDVKTETA